MTQTEVRTRRALPAEIGAMLHEARNRSGQSARQAADAAGIGKPYLRDIEAGRRCPSAAVAQALADVLESAGTPRPAQDAAAAIAVAVELVTAQLNGIPFDYADALEDVDPVVVCEALVAQLTLLLRQVSPKLRGRLLETWGTAIALQRAGGR
jgi:transcriptional regulator with XRE-family HTH domain